MAGSYKGRERVTGCLWEAGGKCLTTDVLLASSSISATSHRSLARSFSRPSPSAHPSPPSADLNSGTAISQQRPMRKQQREIKFTRIIKKKFPGRTERFRLGTVRLMRRNKVPKTFVGGRRGLMEGGLVVGEKKKGEGLVWTSLERRDVGNWVGWWW